MEADRSQQLRDATSGTQPLRLLVVEDHSDLRWALQAFVEALGYDARFVESAASAFKAVGERPYDVLLCDIELPDCNGWDLLKQMEAGGHRPPHAIAMSVFNLGEDVARSIASGCRAGPRNRRAHCGCPYDLQPPVFSVVGCS